MNPAVPPGTDPPGTPAELPYAGFATRHGIVFQIAPDRTVLEIPETKMHRDQAIKIRITLFAAGLFASLPVVSVVGKKIAAGTPLDPAALFEAAQPAVIIWAVLVTVAVVVTLRRSKKLRFEVDLRRFHIVGPVFDAVRGIHIHRRIAVPREHVTDIKGYLEGMGLSVRIEGMEIYEFMHDFHPEVRLWVAARLREALGLGPDPSAPAPALS